MCNCALDKGQAILALTVKSYSEYTFASVMKQATPSSWMVIVGDLNTYYFCSFIYSKYCFPQVKFTQAFSAITSETSRVETTNFIGAIVASDTNFTPNFTSFTTWGCSHRPLDYRAGSHYKRSMWTSPSLLCSSFSSFFPISLAICSWRSALSLPPLNDNVPFLNPKLVLLFLSPT